MTGRSAPVIGLRYRIVLAVVGLAVAFGVPLTASAGATKKTKHCQSGQVSRTIKYVHRKGGPVDHATGCVVKRVTVPKSFAGIQRKVRALALTFVPAEVARAFHTNAARRVAATDPKTDAALGADVTAHAPAPAPAPAPAAVTADSGTDPPLYLHHYTKLDTADDKGESFVSGSFTKATHVTGGRSASSSKTVTVTHLINKCPDAAGIAHGTLDFKLRDLRIAGPRTITETSTLHAQILAHFDDTAHISSVEVIGTWSFAVSTRHTNRSVGGDVAASNFRQTGGSNYFDLPTTVTTGTDDEIVTGGGPLGAWVAEALAHTYIEDMLNSIPHGVCVNIVPDSPTVHVAPGGTVAIVAHLTDHHDQTFPGTITEYNSLNRVSPTKADGNPDARFTYTAPASAMPGDTDVVQLSHLSKRGKGHGGTVNVIVGKQPFPQRFDGAWTRVFTSSGLPGWTETVRGTATYLRNPLFPQSVEGQTSIPYEVQSASVHWTVSGSSDQSGGCTVTYSGSGDVPAMTNDSYGGTRLTLEDVSNKSAAPKPEPMPYYYSIQATGESQPFPQFDITYTPACHAADHQQGIVARYLDVGFGGNFTADTPADQVQKSADLRLLAGHLTTPESSGPATDDTWSFSGSG